MTKETTVDPVTGLPVVKESQVRAYTLFDANSALAKFRNSPSAVISSNGFVMPAGTSIGTLSESSQSPNVGETLGTAMGTAMRIFTGQTPTTGK